MPVAADLSALFRRDLTRVIQQLQAFENPADLWALEPGISNSAGNLVLHLEGNLREYIGRQLGGVAFQRDRPAEFSDKGVSPETLIARMTEVRGIVVQAIEMQSDADLATIYPENVLGQPISKLQFLIHLQGHLNYHLGQIDYLRRMRTQRGAIPLAGL